MLGMQLKPTFWTKASHSRQWHLTESGILLSVRLKDATFDFVQQNIPMRPALLQSLNPTPTVQLPTISQSSPNQSSI